jgi:hypothetical protein
MAEKQRDNNNSLSTSSLEPVKHLSPRLQQKLLKREYKQQKQFRSSGKSYPLVISKSQSGGVYWKLPQPLKSLLYGIWFGHSLYSVMTVAAMIAWILTAIFDVIWLISHSSWAAHGAFVTVIVGIFGTLVATVTILTYRSYSFGAGRKFALNHTFLNISPTILYLISFVLRLFAGAGDSIAAVITGLLGLVSVIYAAYLAGNKMFRS